MHQFTKQIEQLIVCLDCILLPVLASDSPDTSLQGKALLEERDLIKRISEKEKASELIRSN